MRVKDLGNDSKKLGLDGDIVKPKQCVLWTNHVSLEVWCWLGSSLVWPKPIVQAISKKRDDITTYQSMKATKLFHLELFAIYSIIL